MNPIYGLIGRLSSIPMLLAPQTDISAHIRAAATIIEDPTQQHLSAVAAQWGAVTVERKLFVQSGDTAVIPVHGVLVNRSMWAYSSVTGYNFLEAAYRQACEDPTVVRIVLDIASFGGEAQGCFETVELLRAMENRKPTLAVITNACSAAYAFALVADKLVASKSSYNGSIGVVTMHVDFSKMLDEAGIKVKYMYCGARKIDGSPYLPLSEEAEAATMGRVKAFYSSFVALVARFKPMSAEVVEKTEAAVYTAEEALAIGLIDAVETPQTAIANFVSGSSGTSLENETMSGTTTQPTPEQQAASATAAAAAAATQAAAATAAASATAATDADKARADATTAERARIDSIMSCDEAKDRKTLATHLAFKTSMSFDDAKSMLAASAKEVAASAANPLAAAMAATGGGAGIGADTAASDNKDQTPADRMLGAYSKATGFKVA